MSFLQSGNTISLQALFGPRRVIKDITVDAILDENTVDSLMITQQPVQYGASITDHSFLQPVVLSMRILQQVSNPIVQLVNTFSGGGLSELYQDFLDLQADREPFTITTPKRVYESMLISTIRMNTDKYTENILSLNLSFQQVVIVSVSTVQVDPTLQRNAQTTQATQNAGKKSSGLYQLDSGVRSLFSR